MIKSENERGLEVGRREDVKIKIQCEICEFKRNVSLFPSTIQYISDSM